MPRLDLQAGLRRLALEATATPADLVKKPQVKAAGGMTDAPDDQAPCEKCGADIPDLQGSHALMGGEVVCDACWAKATPEQKGDAPVKAGKTEVKAGLSLHDGLVDMVLGGRLTEDMVPDDFQWLLGALGLTKADVAAGHADEDLKADKTPKGRLKAAAGKTVKCPECGASGPDAFFDTDWVFKGHFKNIGASGDDVYSVFSAEDEQWEESMPMDGGETTCQACGHTADTKAFGIETGGDESED